MAETALERCGPTLYIAPHTAGPAGGPVGCAFASRCAAIAVAIWDEAWYSPFFALTVFGLALVGSATLTARLSRQA